MRPQRLLADVAVGVELLQELGGRQVVDRARKPQEDGLLDARALGRRQLLPEGLRAVARLLVVVARRVRALEREEIERRHLDVVVAEDVRPVGEDVGEVAARPVQDGHEVVADGLDVTGREVPQRLLVVLDIRAPIARVLLDVLVDGHGLDHAPRHAGVLHLARQSLDLLNRPDFARTAPVKRGDDVRHARLPNLAEADRVLRPIPSPS